MLYLDLARAYNFTGEAERGLSWARKALELAPTVGGMEEIAMTHCEIGIAHAHLQQVHEAETHYREAIRLGQQTKGYLGKFAVRRSLNNIAVLEHLRGNFRADLDGRQKALAMAEEVRDQAWIAWQAFNVGTPLWRLGEWQSARAYYSRALMEPAGVNYQVSAYLQCLDEDWESALVSLRADVAGAERRRDVQRAFIDLMLMAEAALRLGQYRDAEKYARRGKEMQYPASFWTWPELLYHLAESLARQGRLDEATAVCDEAEATVRAVSGTGAFGAIHQLRGIIAAAKGQRDEAMRHFHTAIGIYDEFPQPYAQARIFEDLGTLYADEDPIKASEAYARALAIYERLGVPKSTRRVRETVERLQMSVP